MVRVGFIFKWLRKNLLLRLSHEGKRNLDIGVATVCSAVEVLSKSNMSQTNLNMPRSDAVPALPGTLETQREVEEITIGDVNGHKAGIALVNKKVLVALRCYQGV